MVKDVNEGWLSAGQKAPSEQPQAARGKPKPAGKRPGTKAAAGKTRVGPHTREVETGRGLFGPRKRTVRVDAYNREVNGSSTRNGQQQRKGPGKKTSYKRRAKKAISPKSAKKNLVQAWRKNQKGHNVHAILLALLGLGKLLLWTTLHGTFLFVGAIAALMAAAALVVDEITES